MAGAAPDSASLLLQARQMQNAGDLSGAERLYRRVLSQQSNNADALHQFGVLACQQGNNRIAAKRIKRAIAIDESVPDYHLNLGVVHEIAGDFESAIGCYGNALDRGADATATLLRIEQIVRVNQRYDLFIDILDRVIAAQSGLPEAHYMRGVAFMLQRRHRDAAEAFRHTIALTPGLASAHANLASALLDLGDAAGALDACNNCLNLDPRHTDALAIKTIASNEAGDDVALHALQDFDMLLQIGRIEPPAGYDDLASFNAALVRDIQAHPTLRVDPDHRSCHFAAQTDDLMQAPSAAFAAFAGVIEDAVARYRGKLTPQSPHPFLANPAPETDLVVWATVMNAQGHQSAHIHPSAWLSGVYYPLLPDLVSAEDEAHLGWIEFGRPPGHFPVSVEPRLRLIKPEEGLLLLFPSYIYHRTVPYDSDAMRISIAFDLDTEFAKQR